MRSYTNEVVTLWYRAPDVLMGSKKYSTSVDMWSVGCIFAEMVNGRPLFPGNSDADQLLKIFEVLGTPSPNLWPGMKELSEYKENFPIFPGSALKEIVPGLDSDGLELLNVMLRFNPDERISAEEALRHKYFEDLGLHKA